MERGLPARQSRGCAHRPGEMAEWLKAHAWKACVPQGTVGSNPTLSARCTEETSFFKLLAHLHPPSTMTIFRQRFPRVDE